MNDTPKFLNPDVEISKHGLKLPHWQQDGSTYFLTFRLGDSIPHTKLAKWKEERAIWLQVHPKPWSATEEMEYHRRFSNVIEKWLDMGEGECVLGDAGAANAVGEVLRSKDGARYRQHAFVVMPNHVHVLVSLGDGESLEGLLKIWKGVSSRRVNLALNRSGELWQGNYFDRLIRDQEHFWNCARYIRRNPSKARLPHHRYFLHESSAVKQVLDFKETLKE